MSSRNIFQHCAGYCKTCRLSHTLPAEPAQQKARRLIDILESRGTIAWSDLHEQAAPAYSTAPLFGAARGKMFGVLECLAPDSSRTWLYAFSGQYNGLWEVPGWVPPLFDIEAFRKLNDPTEKKIKAIGGIIEAALHNSEYREMLRKERRTLSRELMPKLHALYRLHNFRGQAATLNDALGIKTGQNTGKPTGIGDCCAPKLLNQAAAAGLAPLSMAEFYFGRENRSGSRQHGTFYPPCPDKCRPLLGFMLCGAEERRTRYGG